VCFENSVRPWRPQEHQSTSIALGTWHLLAFMEHLSFLVRRNMKKNEEEDLQISNYMGCVYMISQFTLPVLWRVHLQAAVSDQKSRLGASVGEAPCSSSGHTLTRVLPVLLVLPASHVEWQGGQRWGDLKCSTKRLRDISCLPTKSSWREIMRCLVMLVRNSKPNWCYHTSMNLFWSTALSVIYSPST